MAPKYESWQDAYARIVHEVQIEMAGAPEDEQYAEYRRRCIEWKRERGIRT